MTSDLTAIPNVGPAIARMLQRLGINSLDELPRISPLLSDGSNGFDDVV